MYIYTFIYLSIYILYIYIYTHIIHIYLEVARSIKKGLKKQNLLEIHCISTNFNFLIQKYLPFTSIIQLDIYVYVDRYTDR